MHIRKIEFWILNLAGTALMAVGIQCFLEPAHLVAGGITGIGIILDALMQRHFALTTPLWLVNFVINLPLFLLAWRLEGGRFVGKTILTSLLFSIMLFLVQGYSFFGEDFILASVYGGVLVGIGLGFVLKSGATTGGVDLAAALLHRFWHYPSIGRKIFYMDAAIIAAGTLVFGGLSGLYAILSVFITEQCLRWVLEKGDIQKGAIVISHKAKPISEALSLKFGREVMAFCGVGQNMTDRVEFLYCVFSQKEIQAVQSIIINIDRSASLYLIDVRDVLDKASDGS